MNVIFGRLCHKKAIRENGAIMPSCAQAGRLLWHRNALCIGRQRPMHNVQIIATRQGFREFGPRYAPHDAQPQTAADDDHPLLRIRIKHGAQPHHELLALP
jgi:hypothetical protein